MAIADYVHNMVQWLVGSNNISPVTEQTASASMAETAADATANKKPGLTISPSEIKSIISVLNQARRATTPPAANMQEVAWDPALATQLQKFAAANGPAWFFLPNGVGPKGGTNAFNGFSLMSQPPFQQQFPGYGFVIHDTTQSKIPDGILKIIKYRANQKGCINYNDCSTDSYSNFESCGDPLVQVPGQKCSWATQYYPRMMQGTLSKFACVPLDVHGPNAPKVQDMSFWCYGLYKAGNNDVPYVSGSHCSACPDEAPKCVDGLCVADPAATAKLSM